MNSLLKFRHSRRGNLATLAKELGVDKSTVTRWAIGQIPADRVNDVARITGIPREELRPDIFGDPAPSPEAAA